MADNKEFKHISLPANFSIDDDFDSDKFFKVRLDFAHDGVNPNRSRISKKLLEGNKNSLFLSPILGSIQMTKDETYEFKAHDIEFRPNPFKNNEMQMYYIEQILGIVPPEDKANFEVREVDGRNRVFVDAYIYKNYSNFAEDILRQYEQTPVSMEIDILKYSYSVTENVYDIEDFKYTGITILNQNCGTGMIGANLKLFSSQDDLKMQMSIMLQDLKNTFNLELNNKNTEERSNSMDLENNTISTDVITDTTDTADTTTFDTQEVPTIVTEDESDNTNIIDTPVEPNVTTTENTETETNTEFENTDDNSKMFTKTFTLSHDDIRTGIYKLLQDIEVAENDYFSVDNVFDDCFYYSGWVSNKHYRQAYTKTNDSVAFNGDRVEVFIEYLTASEKTALETLKNNYSAEHEELEKLREFKSNYDLNEKTNLMDKWSTQIGKEMEFEKLKTTYADMSLEDIEVKCKCIFADAKLSAFSSKGVSTESNKKEKEFTPVTVAISDIKIETETDAYGGLFKELGIN